MTTNTAVSCSRECGDSGHSCRLHYFAITHGLNVKILERGSLNALSAFAYSREEMLRLGEKRQFMERLGVTCTDQVDCRKRDQVERREADSRQREKAVADALGKELAK